jgi:peptidyl-dipeptidase Dcp
MNEALFKRVKAVYEKRESLGLEPDQMRLLTETYKDYERSGATLSETAKEELKQINAKISELELLFEQHILKETGEYNLVIENENDLAGLSENQIAAAAARAKSKGMEGWWVFGLDNPSLMPFLQSADNRDLRIKLNEAYLNVGNNNNENDNKQIVIDLIKLRDRKAQIMGFDNYAQYVLVERMAKTPEAVYDLLNRLWTPALKVAKQEYKDLKELAKKDGINEELKPGDWRYYFEKAKAS